MRADARNPRVVIPSHSRGTLFSTLEGYKYLHEIHFKKHEMNF